MEYVVAAVPVFGTMVPHVAPPSVDLSIMYPVIGEPPLFAGAVQMRLICDDDTAVADRLVGADGGVALDVTVNCAEAEFDTVSFASTV